MVSIAHVAMVAMLVSVSWMSCGPKKTTGKPLKSQLSGAADDDAKSTPSDDKPPSRPPDVGSKSPPPDTHAGADTSAKPDLQLGPDEDDGEISILTLNMQTGFNDGEEIAVRTRVVADFIKKHLPDAVALQEVSETTNNYINQGQKLKKMTGYEFEWRQTHRVPLYYEEGIAVLSRWPIDSTSSASLPHRDLGGSISRAIFEASIDHPTIPFQVFVTHMTVVSSESVKNDQAKAVSAFVDENQSEDFALLAGDMNAKPDSTAMQFLRGRAEIDGESAGFTDAWLAVREANPGPTHPADSPKKRIDYIYVTETPRSSPTKNCRRVFKKPHDDVWASDHLGVFCTFEIDE